MNPCPGTTAASVLVVYRRVSELDEDTIILGPGKFGTWVFFTLLLFEINSLRYTLKKDLNGFTCRTTLPGGHKIFSFAQTKMCLSELVLRG